MGVCVEMGLCSTRRAIEDSQPRLEFTLVVLSRVKQSFPCDVFSSARRRSDESRFRRVCVRAVRRRPTQNNTATNSNSNSNSNSSSVESSLNERTNRHMHTYTSVHACISEQAGRF